MKIFTLSACQRVKKTANTAITESTNWAPSNVFTAKTLASTLDVPGRLVIHQDAHLCERWSRPPVRGLTPLLIREKTTVVVSMIGSAKRTSGTASDTA